MRRTLILALSLAAAPGCSRDRDLPESYRRLTVPPDLLTSPARRARGRVLYERACFLCHGEKGDGRGVRREGLSRPPRDFTDEQWRSGVTPRHVFFAIREGIPGTPMAAWRTFDDRETWDLVAYVLGIGTSGAGAPEAGR